MMSENPRPFEEIYAEAGEDLEAIPWASLAASPSLVAWLDSGAAPEPAAGERALVIGCGLGDDAEELSDRGWRTTGFDISPTAIDRCRERFPGSAVEYEVADLFALPRAWYGAFGLVIEIRTLQSLPLDVRAAAVGAIGRAVAPGGRLFVRCFGRKPGQPVERRPWPVSRDELAGFERAGLSARSFEESHEQAETTFMVVYERR
jgi:SAM-dependent methyltransferase